MWRAKKGWRCIKVKISAQFDWGEFNFKARNWRLYPFKDDEIMKHTSILELFPKIQND